MSNYRIVIEAISEHGKKELPEELRGGVECEGFVIIADKGEGSTTVIQDVNKIDIASSLACSNALMSAAHIAKAMREARKIENTPSSFADLLKELAR